MESTLSLANEKGASFRCVINMSLGDGLDSSLNSAVSSAVDNRIVVVVAAGNDGKDACNYSPSSATKAITVGSTTSTDAKSSFSNFGSCVDVYAPLTSFLLRDHQIRRQKGDLSKILRPTIVLIANYCCCLSIG